MGELHESVTRGNKGSMSEFRIHSTFEPAGDQPEAIEALVGGLVGGERDQVLLGVTGSGKTFTMAQVIATVTRPTLILAPNKTLAAQLYGEMKGYFPENSVEFSQTIVLTHI